MLRVAFVGKGGSGKSSIAGTLARRGEPAAVPALEQTRAHVTDVKTHAAAYVTALEKLV